VYGDASTTFISRPSELRILHLLSSRYALGPKIHGTFTNGRLEEYFPSRALTATDLRDPETSRSIGKRMAELHSVDLDVLDPLESGATGREPTVLQSIKEWLAPARRMYGRLERLEAEGALIGLLAGWVQAFDLARLEREIEAYVDWLRQYERGQNDGEAGKAWRMVFCRKPVLDAPSARLRTRLTSPFAGRSIPDNDAQYGNLLLLRTPPPPPAPKHHSIIVVDFEYASPNPYPYDIANHFSEWQADYHHSTRSYSMSEHASYPSESDRHNFYRAYLETSKGRPARAEELAELDRGVEVWRPAGSASWALWGVISAESQIEALERREADWSPDWEYLVRLLTLLPLKPRPGG
jgi:choline kinase